MSDRPGSHPDNRTLGDLADEMAAVLGEAFASAIFGLRGISVLKGDRPSASVHSAKWSGRSTPDPPIPIVAALSSTHEAVGHP
jgi:hypothetical protein